jgi:hypothetical protein
LDSNREMGKGGQPGKKDMGAILEKSGFQKWREIPGGGHQQQAVL